MRQGFRTELCAVVAVPKGSELLENTVAKLCVLPGAQQWLRLQSPSPISSGQTRAARVTSTAPVVWWETFLAAWLHSLCSDPPADLRILKIF